MVELKLAPGYLYLQVSYFVATRQYQKFKPSRCVASWKRRRFSFCYHVVILSWFSLNIARCWCHSQRHGFASVTFIIRSQYEPVFKVRIIRRQISSEGPKAEGVKTEALAPNGGVENWRGCGKGYGRELCPSQEKILWILDRSAPIWCIFVSFLQAVLWSLLSALLLTGLYKSQDVNCALVYTSAVALLSLLMADDVVNLPINSVCMIF